MEKSGKICKSVFFAALIAFLLGGLFLMGTERISYAACEAENVRIPADEPMSLRSVNDRLIADYSFAERPEDGITVKNNAAGEGAVGDALVQNPDTARWEDSSLVFSGEGTSDTAPGTWVSLPENILSGKESATISIEVKAKAEMLSSYHFLWSIGNSRTDEYWFMNMRDPRATIKYYGSEKTANGTALSADHWYTLTSVINADAKTLSFYIDGKKAGQISDDGMSLRRVSDQSRNTIGRAPYNDPLFKGAVASFCIYDRALDDAEIQDISRETAARNLIMEAADALSVKKGSKVVGDLYLPTEGINGTTISWSSSNENVIAGDGSVTLKDVEEKVILTAVISLDGVNITRTIPITVPAKEEAAQALLEQLLVPYVLTEKDTLPNEVGGVKVTWEASDMNLIKADGTITAPAKGMSDELKLKAKLTLNGKESEKSYTIRVMGKDSRAVLGYTRDASVNGGLRVGDSLHLAYSEDGVHYEALNTNYGVLFAEAEYASAVSGSTRTVKDPYIFRLKDGGFGVISARGYTDGSTDSPGQVLVFTSEDLIQYKQDGGLKSLKSGSDMENLTCEYDASEGHYRIGWDTDGVSYYCMTDDFLTFTEAKEGAAFQARSVENVDIDNAILGNVIYVTAEEGKRIHNKLSRVKNVSVENAACHVKVGETVDVSDLRVKANYSDGSSAQKRVEWNQEQLAAIDTGKAGVYEIDGTVVQEAFPFPMMRGRADPNAVYYKGRYYFIATDDRQGRNQNIYIRGAETIAGLADSGDIIVDGIAIDSNEHLLWDGTSAKVPDADGHLIDNPHLGIHWAPELHVIDEELYCFFSMRSSNQGGRYVPQSYVAKLKENGDPLEAQDWEEPVRVQKQDGSPLCTDGEGITLDMTYFEVAGVSYVCWSQRLFTNGENPGLVIAKVDKEEPWKLTSEPQRISSNTYSWERYESNQDGEGCNEGPNVLVNQGIVYMVFSGNGVCTQYAAGMLTAKEGSDLTDPDSWTKSNYPWMHNGVFEGQYGMGHNSFFTDEYGEIYNVYHAMSRGDTNTERDASIVPVHFREDGSPVLDMRPEEVLLPECRSVKAVITVENMKKPSYTVKFNSAGGSAVKNQTIEAGKKVINPQKPVRRNYLFAGWYINGTKYDFNRAVNANLTLTAKWKKVKVGASKILKIRKKGSGKCVVSVRKVSGAKGYQYVYSADKHFRKGVKKINSKKRKVVLKKLKKGQIYYVKVRACKSDSKGKKVYGKYSVKKKIKDKN